MGFNIGDKVKQSVNTIVWTIMEEDSINHKSRLEADLGHGLITSQWVSWPDLLQNYTFVTNSNDTNQTDWFGNWDLPEGYSVDTSKLKQEECHHDFKQYTGLQETYKYCIKCNIKRSWEP